MSGKQTGSEISLKKPTHIHNLRPDISFFGRVSCGFRVWVDDLALFFVYKSGFVIYLQHWLWLKVLIYSNETNHNTVYITIDTLFISVNSFTFISSNYEGRKQKCLDAKMHCVNVHTPIYRKYHQVKCIACTHIQSAIGQLKTKISTT